MHVRRAVLADLDVLVSGNLTMAQETEGLQLDAATVRLGVLAVLDNRAPGAFWVAERDAQVVGQLLITFEWSDWRNRPVWWIQSVHVHAAARRRGVFRSLYSVVRREAREAGAGGLRLYVDTRNTGAQAVYRSLGMNGDHYHVFEDMFVDQRPTA